MVDLYAVRGTNGRMMNLHRPPHALKVHEFRIAAFSCKPPCVCDGYEVCLHLLHPHGQGPLWPVLNAASVGEARAIQAQLLRFASTLDPSAEVELLTAALEAWARANGWEKTHHIVWRHKTHGAQKTRTDSRGE
jgi:hypothetical protein